MLVSAHARQRYLEQFPDLETITDGEIVHHLNICEPVSDVELLVIRKSKRATSNIPDRGNAKHYIDRRINLIFVVRYPVDKVKYDDADGVIVTCYCAPYLDITDKMIGTQNGRERERDRILSIFAEARTLTSATPWEVGLYLLYSAEFRIFLGDTERMLRAVDGRTGLCISQKAVSSNKSFKPFSESHFYQVCWEANYRWTFAEIGIRKIADF